MPEIIFTEKLTKQYNNILAVDDLNLQVHKGEIFGFLGPNGAGKTTTIRVLTTLAKPSSGSAFVENYDVVRQSEKVKKVIGVVQQHLSLDQDLTLRENMDFRARLHHMSSADRKQRINELLEYVGLSSEADRDVKQLSGGMRKAAMIASSLVHEPKILFLDEPTVGLDVQTRRRIWELIRRLNNDGASIFLTTHYIEEAEALCDRVGIIHQGKLIALGEPLELRSKVGMFTVETLTEGSQTKYKYFSTRDDATQYAQNVSKDVKSILIRESNLEDIFVELTGHKVGGQ